MTMTRRRIGTLSLALLLGPVNAAVAQREARDDESAITDPRVQHRTYTMQDTGETIPYALFVPTTYDGSEPYRLMVSLHGAGRQYDWLMGYAGFLDRAERDGYIIVTPLGYTRRGGYGYRGNERSDQLAEKDVMTVVDMVRKEFNVDERRIYLWGHSMGGAGTYYIASRYPDVWAGLAAAAGGGMSARYVDEDAIRHIPFLVLHGSEGRDGPGRAVPRVSGADEGAGNGAPLRRDRRWRPLAVHLPEHRGGRQTVRFLQHRGEDALRAHGPPIRSRPSHAAGAATSQRGR